MMNLEIDIRAGNKSRDEVFNNINLDEAFKMVDKLDGQLHTLLNFERQDMWRLCIGGGKEWFVVTAFSPNDENFTLLNSDGNTSKMIELCAGGQFADFPMTIVVKKDMVKKVVSKFFDSREKELNWEAA